MREDGEGEGREDGEGKGCRRRENSFKYLWFDF